MHSGTHDYKEIYASRDAFLKDYSRVSDCLLYTSSLSHHICETDFVRYADPRTESGAAENTHQTPDDIRKISVAAWSVVRIAASPQLTALSAPRGSRAVSLSKKG